MNTKQATEAIYSAVDLMQHAAQHAKLQTLPNKTDITALEVELNATEQALFLARTALADLKYLQTPINTDSPFIEDSPSTCHELRTK